MAKLERASIWFDPEGDHIEIVFGRDFGRGEMIPTKGQASAAQG